MLTVLLALSVALNVAALLRIVFLCDQLEAANVEHDRLVRLMDETREFAGECLSQSKRMAMVAAERAADPRIKGA